MALKTTKTKLEAEQVPEVMAFLAAQSELYDFIRQHAAVFDRYAELAEQYNDSLEAADKKLRVLCDDQVAGVSCGPFAFKHFTTKYDADALLRSVNNDPLAYGRLGGITETIQVNRVDTKMMESLIDRGAVPVDHQRMFVKRVPNYEKPKKVGLP